MPIPFASKVYAVVGLGFLLLLAFWLWHRFVSPHTVSHMTSEQNGEMTSVEREALERQLEPAVYHVIVNKGTERPFSSPLNGEKRSGTYVAADTGEPVFRSEQKFDSGTGWPSFTAPLSPDAIRLADDYGLLGKRTEVLSSAGGHLGHVFDDGPAPTGQRYCINGLALRFIPDEVE